MKPTDWMGAVMVGLAALGAAGAASADGERPRTITINASGSVEAEPDLADISLGVLTEAEKAGKAVADNAKAMSRVIEALKKAGIAAKDIATDQYAINPIYAHYKSASGGQSNRIDGFRVTNNATVVVRDVTRLGELIDLAAENGANQFRDIDFRVSGQDAKLDEARREAMANAIRRAKLYAEAAGIELGKVMTISEHVQGLPPQPRYRGREASTMAAATPIEPGQQRLTVNVSVVWQLD
jgi:uncharacterized protein YggE